MSSPDFRDDEGKPCQCANCRSGWRHREYRGHVDVVTQFRAGTCEADGEEWPCAADRAVRRLVDASKVVIKAWRRMPVGYEPEHDYLRDALEYLGGVLYSLQVPDPLDRPDSTDIAAMLEYDDARDD